MQDKSQLSSGHDKLYEHHRFKADKKQSLLRIDKFLGDRLEHTSRTQIQKAAEAGCILVNQKAVKVNYKVKPDDEISIVFATPPKQITLIAEAMDLDIVYEDSVLLLVNKPAGLVVHPGVGNHSGTLINGLLHYLENLPKPKSILNNLDILRPGLVHRIDKDTSGLLVIAKTDKAMNKLAKQFFNKTTKRQYLALVWGNLKTDEGTIDVNIGRDKTNRKLRTTYPEGDKGKRAVTHYKVKERFGYVTLLTCRLETGRTHQIRVHLKHIGHPLFNDVQYGGDKMLKGTGTTKFKTFVYNCFKLLPGQALHAQTLGFVHPESGKTLFFEQDLPPKFAELLQKWRNFIQHTLKDEVLGNSAF